VTYRVSKQNENVVVGIRKVERMQNTVAKIVIGLRAGQPGLDSRQGQGREMLSSPSLSYRQMGSPSFHSNGYHGLYHELNRLGRKADHSSPSGAEVKSAWNYTSTPAIRLHGVVLN